MKSMVNIVVLFLSVAVCVNAAEIKFGGLDNLSAFADKVREGKTVEICFFGGSITHGVGASKYANNYYYKTQMALFAEIKKRGADAHFSNISIGGTGSKFGCYRIGAQALVRKPDLFIIEFAVNDSVASDADVTMEALVRQILRTDPETGIVLFYTTKAKINDKYYANGLLPETIYKHHKVAEHYGLAEVLTGFAVSDAIKAGCFSNKTFYVDGTHPSDLGHAFYADILTKALMPMFDLPKPKDAKRVLPESMFGSELEHAGLEAITPSGRHEGWTEIDNQWNWHGVPIWRCLEKETPITFKAEGKNIQIVYNGRVMVKWNVNGESYSRKLNWHKGQPMPGIYKLYAGDDNKEIAVTVIALPDKDGKVRGEVWGYYYVRTTNVNESDYEE